MKRERERERERERVCACETDRGTQNRGRGGSLREIASLQGTRVYGFVCCLVELISAGKVYVAVCVLEWLSVFAVIGLSNVE
jgi:hypothetical protein